MKVLLVEDGQQYATSIQAQLRENYGFIVDYVGEPAAACTRLAETDYDVVVVDVLYQRLSDRYSEYLRQLKPTSTLRDLAPFNVSGLTVLFAASSGPRVVPRVVWTSGDTNRGLHLLLANQELDVRSFSSKDEPIDCLKRAIVAAVEGREHVDNLLRPYMPRRGMPSISKSLFREIRWRAIWRAWAAGATSHSATAKMASYEPKTVRNTVGDMFVALAAFDPGVLNERTPADTLGRYAARNWEFFLDSTVVRMYPHEGANL